VRRLTAEQIDQVVALLRSKNVTTSPPARRAWSWPDLMRHTFAVDVLACPRCGGRMRVVATIEDPVVIRKILT
jgi:hypothetical protein